MLQEHIDEVLDAGTVDASGALRHMPTVLQALEPTQRDV